MYIASLIVIAILARVSIAYADDHYGRRAMVAVGLLWTNLLWMWFIVYMVWFSGFVTLHSN